MYNTEKYIGALLESLLAQTFQDFEVVVVDNGSTDNSAKIVKSYVPKFGGRLKTSRIEINSGGPAPAHNKSIALSRGKYILAMDSDDLLNSNALETLYNYAEEFNAEVVTPERNFVLISNSKNPSVYNVNITPRHQGALVDKPTLETNNLNERIQKFCRLGYAIPAWSYFVKKDFLSENNIDFPKLNSSHDIIWTIKVICFSKNLLRIPQPLYAYRINTDSITNKKRDTKEAMKFWSVINAEGLRILDNFCNTQKFFTENPQCRWNLLEIFNYIHFNESFKYLSQINPQETFNLIKPEFDKIFGDSAQLVAYFYTAMRFSQLKERMATQRIIELENKLKQLQGG